MRKHLKIRALGIAFVVLAAVIPAPVLASGFYLPWWGEALAFLVLTPVGWLCAVLVVVAVMGVAWGLMRRGPHD